jgi:hypothetical protein
MGFRKDWTTYRMTGVRNAGMNERTVVFLYESEKYLLQKAAEGKASPRKRTMDVRSLELFPLE